MSAAPPPRNATGSPETAGFAPDPLLQSGSFISSSPGNGGALGEGPEPAEDRGATSNGTDPAKKQSENAAESKSRRRVLPMENWLPAGWTVEDRVRSSGASAGTVDKYYFDPASGRRFRSKTEVMYYLEHGTPKKKKKSEGPDVNLDPSETPGSGKQSKSGKKAQKPLNFDFHNAPEKVTWVLTNLSEESWTPFIGDEKVSKSVSEEWTSAFTEVTTRNGGQITF